MLPSLPITTATPQSDLLACACVPGMWHHCYADLTAHLFEKGRQLHCGLATASSYIHCKLTLLWAQMLQDDVIHLLRVLRPEL